MDKSELTSKLKQHKWILRESEFNMYSQTEVELRSDTHYLYFISDSEGVELTITKIDDTFDELGHSLDRDYSYFNYYVDGNKVYLNYELSGYKNLVYENGVLHQDKDVIWYPSALNSSERDEMNRLMEEKGYKSDFNFDFSIGFDNKSPLSYTVYDTRTGIYTHSILWGFGVPSNTFARGITSFGIALTTDDGTVDTGTGRSEEASVSTHNIGSYRNIRCFMGTLTDNSEHWWNTRVTITSKKKTITLKYTCIFYAGKNPSYDQSHFSLDSKGYVYANTFNSESYSPSRIVDQNGNVVNPGGNDEQGQGSSSGLTSCPNSNHPHWIDLGLPSGTQWRCCNEGASTPEAYGGYYTFGQVSSAPTLEQINELVSHCSYTWTTQNGVKGGKFTGPNGGTIFLPAAGYVWDGGGDVGSDGDYWSSTPSDGDYAYGLYFYSGDARRSSIWRRSRWRSVRPVR